MSLLNIFLMMGQPGQPMTWKDWMPLVLMGVVFYFFMIRPQQKKAKDQKNFHEEIKKGDRIVTNGGIHGKIAEVKGTTFIIEIEGGTRMKIEQSAVSLELSKQFKKQ